MREENQYRIADLILRYLETKASLEEITELKEWISLSEENRIFFQKMRNIWEMTDPSTSQMNIDIQSALLKTKVKAGIEPGKTNVSTPKQIVLYFQRIAAILFFPILITLFTLMMNKKEESLTYYKASTPYGSISEIILPDSSKVWLDAGSTLEYPSQFINNTRRVCMSGEAYFEVHADKNNPFIIQADELEITATGTAFNVASFTHSMEQKITLISGKVSVSQGKETKHLLPGQQLTYQRNTKRMEITSTDTFKYIAWKDGIIAFRDDSLETILDRLEQVYKVRFVMKDLDIKQYTYRATFKGENLDEIINCMEEGAPIKFRKRYNDFKQGDTLTIEVSKK